MSKQITRHFDCKSESQAREKLAAEVENWTWLTRKRKSGIVAEATIERTETKYGPVFTMTIAVD